MLSEKSKEILLELKANISNIRYKDENELDRIRKRLYMISDKIFKVGNNYIKQIEQINFYPTIRWSNMPQYLFADSWESGKSELINLINIMIEDVELSSTSENSETYISEKNAPKKTNIDKSIFIVHGHNNEVKIDIARTLEKIDLKPIILHEKPNEGKTIIEKFEKHSNVGFAIILLTDDDSGKSRKEKTYNLRTRQNVILELGYFIGKLGRSRVCPIYIKGVELPSDLHGLTYIEYDLPGHWKFNLVKELKAAGYEIDMNKMI